MVTWENTHISVVLAALELMLLSSAPNGICSVSRLELEKTDHVPELEALMPKLAEVLAETLELAEVLTAALEQAEHEVLEQSEELVRSEELVQVENKTLVHYEVHV